MGKTKDSLVIVPVPATGDRHNITSLVDSCSQKQEVLHREKGRATLNFEAIVSQCRIVLEDF